MTLPLDVLGRLVDTFWLDYSKLIAKYLRAVPESDRVDLCILLQEKSNVYGSCYEKFL